MIYSTEIKDFPKEADYYELLSYKDENDFEWKIARVKNGFFIAYFGDSYFKDSEFDIELKYGKTVFIKNTGCFFIQNSEFEVFYEFRNIIKTGWTDDIWESIEDFLKERLLNNPELIMECEKSN